MPEIIENMIENSSPSYENKIELIKELRDLVSSKFYIFFFNLNTTFITLNDMLL